VAGFSTTAERFAKRGSADNSATEQLRADEELGDGLALAELLGCALLFAPVEVGSPPPEMLNPPMIRARTATPTPAPIATSLK
jgi:hypothetical protein